MTHARTAPRWVLTVAIIVILSGVAVSPAPAAAQESGWYGPYEDGCSYYWDGTQWTGDFDCSTWATTGYGAGWYDAYGDGCLYYFDGMNYTGDVDCSFATSAAYPAGWYGPFEGGCYYEWDGYAYTG